MSEEPRDITVTEKIAASIWSGVFPKKATPEQEAAFLAHIKKGKVK